MSEPDPPPKRSKGQDDDDGDNEDDDDDNEAAGSGTGQEGGEEVSSSKRQPSDYLRKAQPSAKADELAISAAPYLQSTDPALRNVWRIAKHLKKTKLARNVKPWSRTRARPR